MNLADALGEYGWMLTVWLAVGGLAVVVSFACGLALGRAWGLQIAPGYWRRVVRRLALRVWAERARAREERAGRERAEEDAATLRGAREHYMRVMARN